MNSELLEKIDRIIDVLSLPVSAPEAVDGWTPAAKEKFKAFFEDLKSKLLSDEKVPALSISRAMDSWGVVGGDTLELAAQISNELRDLVN